MGSFWEEGTVGILGLHFSLNDLGGGSTGCEAPLGTRQRLVRTHANTVFTFSFHFPRKSAPKKSKADGQ